MVTVPAEASVTVADEGVSSHTLTVQGPSVVVVQVLPVPLEPLTKLTVMEVPWFAVIAADLWIRT